MKKHNIKISDMRQLRKDFQRLKSQWLDETRFISNMSEIVENKNHQEIISKGWKIVPLILKDLKENPHWWFHALHSITGHNPVKSEMAGRLKELSKCWIEWGEQNKKLIHQRIKEND